MINIWKKAILIGLCLTAFVATGCNGPAECPDNLEEAKRLIAEKKYAQGLSLLKENEATYKTCPAMWYQKGLALELQDSFVAAGKAYTEALRLNPPSCPQQVDALTGRGWAYVQQQQFAEASADFMAAYTLAECQGTRQDRNWLQFSLANCYLELGQFSNAKTELDSLLAHAADAYGDGFLLRSQALLKLNQPADALDDLRQALQRKILPEAAYHWRAAECHFAAQQPDSACHYLQLAKEANFAPARNDTRCP